MNVFLFNFDNNLHQAFIKTANILKIITTIPITTTQAERTFSTLNKNIFEESILDHRLNTSSKMSINRNSVHKIGNFDAEKIHHHEVH